MSANDPPVIFLVALADAIAIAAIVVALSVWLAMMRRVQQIERRYQEREIALMSRVDMLERQLSDMRQWARRRWRMRLPPITHSDPLQRAYDALRTLYTREELELIAHDIGIRIDDVGGETVPGIAHRLVDYAQAAGVSNRLIAAVRRTRPNAGV